MRIGLGCPAPEVMGRFYLKVTDASESREVLEHISLCTPCRRLLVVLSESEAGSGAWAERPRAPRIGVHPPHPLLKVAAAVLLIAAATWPWHVEDRPLPGLSEGSGSLPPIAAPGSAPVAREADRRPAAAEVDDPALEGVADLRGWPELEEGADLTGPGGARPTRPGAALGAREPPTPASGPPSAGPADSEPPPDPSLPKALAMIPQEEAPLRPGPEPPRRQDYEAPHSAFQTALERHLSEEAWREYVWDDYVTRPEVLVPVGLALSAAAISHWDRPLERRWEGSLGEHSNAAQVGEISLMAAAALVGVLFPGEDRNGWDEAWTVGETLGAATLTSYALRNGFRRSHATNVPDREEHGRGFGSGSSTNAFAASELLERNSGPAVGLPAFGVAVFTAFASLQGGHRYPSDVLAGAAIGTLSAGIFDSLHWGTGTDGGIARPNLKIALDTDALKECKLTVTLIF